MDICSCGESAPHVIARRSTADGIGVEIWHDGAVTGRLGRALPGVAICRPRSVKALESARLASSLISDDISMYDCAELPRIYDTARKVAARNGSRRDLTEALANGERPTVRFVWVTHATDSTGVVTCRVARLDRIRWPGLAVWHEGGRYLLMACVHHCAPGVRSGEVLVPTGFSFGSQRELTDHLFTGQAVR